MSKCCSGSCQTGVAPENDAQEALVGKFVSEFTIPKMDCPSEERMIRLVLEDVEPKVGLVFDIPNRKLTVYHDDNLAEIATKLESLSYGAVLSSTKESSHEEALAVHEAAKGNEAQEFRILRWLLLINGLMFFVEIILGWIAQSTGLIADSLDMLADAAVYGLAILAVGKAVKDKLSIAHASGWLQGILALGALSEVIRRFIYGSEPVSSLMIAIGLLALVANVVCLFLIFNKKDAGAHMQASWIFSANDVIANIGVIVAGVLVAFTGSRYPDLIIGFIIAFVVLNGARRILKLKS
ncbi:MAG TPA: cation transporter [Colwellia sp.]|nr:cation transporter [Colwellia sp.]|tara:strand:+ start:4441 stop:5328 length:888 start_codon:yes stop_codon:yes gene_type:complete